VLVPSHFDQDGIFSDFHVWMQKNATSYGFYLSYTKDDDRSGYAYEPWHYSYLPKAKEYLESYLDMNIAKELCKEPTLGLTNLDINFYKKYISDYVLGINSVLK
jgi:hypothetical protein